jgi:glycerol uptake facilitator-like aquaporin
MIGLAVEFLATMIFTVVISVVGNDALKVGLCLATLLMFGQGFGVGHLNPAVSFTQFLGGRVNLVRLLLLIAVQMGGAVSGHFLLRLRR